MQVTENILYEIIMIQYVYNSNSTMLCIVHALSMPRSYFGGLMLALHIIIPVLFWSFATRMLRCYVLRCYAKYQIELQLHIIWQITGEGSIYHDTYWLLFSNLSKIAPTTYKFWHSDYSILCVGRDSRGGAVDIGFRLTTFRHLIVLETNELLL